MSSFPDDWVRTVILDGQEIQQAITLYEWRGAVGDFEWVDDTRLRLVGSYLVFWTTDGYWRVILRGGIRGYSLFLHEWIELKGYARQGMNPFDYRQQVASYRSFHSEALLAEHTFLQTIALAMGYSFSLRELIVYNPHGEQPDNEWEGDWEVLVKQLPQHLGRADRALDAARRSDVCQFYQRLGFEKISHNA